MADPVLSIYEANSDTVFSQNGRIINRTKRYVVQTDIATDQRGDVAMKAVRSALYSYQLNTGSIFDETRINIDTDSGGAIDTDSNLPLDYFGYDGTISTTNGYDGVYHVISISLAPKSVESDFYWYDLTVVISNEKSFDAYWTTSGAENTGGINGFGILALNTTLEYSKEDVQYPVLRDIADPPQWVASNSAGDVYQQPIMVTVPTTVIAIERYELFADFQNGGITNGADEVFSSYLYTINSTNVIIGDVTYGAQRLLLRGYSARRDPTYGVYRVRYEFLHKPDQLQNFASGEVDYLEWNPYLLDQGYNKLVNGEKTPITTNDGITVNGSATLLDGSGSPVEAVGGVFTPFWTKVTIYSESDFNDLKLPQST